MGRWLCSQLPPWPGFSLNSPKFTWLDTKQPFGSPSCGALPRVPALTLGCMSTPLPLCWGVTLWGMWQGQASPEGDSDGGEQL